jgi:serine/threonine protein kinase
LHIVTEYIENGSLKDVITKFGCLPECLVQIYAKQILEALVHIHSAGIVHRDIKASNILVSKTGECKLTDFALSANQSTENETDFALIGSPYWSKVSPTM